MQERTYQRRLAKMSTQDRADFEDWALLNLYYPVDRQEFFRFNSTNTLTQLRGLLSIAINKGSHRVAYFKASVAFKKTSQKPEGASGNTTKETDSPIEARWPTRRRTPQT